MTADAGDRLLDAPVVAERRGQVEVAVGPPRGETDRLAVVDERFFPASGALEGDGERS